MKIFIFLLIIIIAIFFIGKKVLYSAKRNLLKDQAAWSGKDIKINYRKSKDVLTSEGNENFLKMIADESQIYLDDQSKKEEDLE